MSSSHIIKEKLIRNLRLNMYFYYSQDLGALHLGIPVFLETSNWGAHLQRLQIIAVSLSTTASLL